MRSISFVVAFSCGACGRFGFEGETASQTADADTRDTPAAITDGNPDDGGIVGDPDGATASCIDPGSGTQFDGTMPCANWGSPMTASAMLTQSNSRLTIAPQQLTNGATGTCFRAATPFGAGGAMLEVVQIVSSPSGRTALRLGIGGQTLTLWAGGNGNIVAEVGTTVIATVAYDAPMMRWWRIRPNGGGVVFETAPDGKVWTQLATSTQAPLASYDVRVFGQTQLVEAAPGVAIIESANLCPP